MNQAAVLLVLAAAAWRSYKLLADDKILDPLRDRLTITREGEIRESLVEFIACPFCLGFWVGFAWTLLYAVWPEGAFWIALPFALSAAIVLTEDLHSSD